MCFRLFPPTVPAWLLIVAFIIATASAAPGAPAPEPKPVTHEDLWSLRQVGSPSPSPDGRWVVVSVTEPAYDEADEVQDLWILPGDGSAPPRRLTSGRAAETSPAWSPDSRRLAFTAKRDGDENPQVYVLDLGGAGGEAQQVSKVALGARQPQWSRDGRWLLFQAPVHREATNDAHNQSIAEARRTSKAKVRIYEHFPVRRWDQWLDDRQMHLFVQPADGAQPARDLLAGTRLTAQPGFRAVGSEGSQESLHPEWTPDGTAVVFSATTNSHQSAFSEVSYQLHLISRDGGEPRTLTPATSSDRTPRFSPDGRRLAFTRSIDRGEIYSVERLMIANWPWNGAPRFIAPGFDRSIGDFTFDAAGSSIFLTAEDAGRVRVWRASVDGSPAQPAWDCTNGVWSGLRSAPAANDPVIFGSWEAAHQPAEVQRVDLRTGARQALTSFNRERLARLDLPPLREFWFTNRHGRALHNYLILPAGFDARKRYPLLVLIHGGHASMWRDAVTRRWNYHLLTAPGYVGLLTDYTGSTGYGEAFTRAIRGDPLAGPADDVNAAADEAVRRFPFIDGTRQAAAGASYGGHLVNWLEATATNRYRCLIGHAGLASLYAQWATSDSIYHRELMMNGPFWESPAPWLAQSPSTYAARFRTPLLLSIGEKDYRVPLNHTLEMWSLLQRQQVPGRLLVWPDENHWISQGPNSRVFYQEVHAWLARWLGKS